MSNNNLLCKYLEAGAKSSAVVLDPALHTGNEQTIYLYHQQRNQIIEYRRDIVESKLRELTAEEAKAIKTLQQAYAQARPGFTPRGAALLNIPEKGTAPAKATPAPALREDDDSDDPDFVDDSTLLDDDEDEDEEEIE
ncbi:MAG: hypothetical protein OQL08_03185 [Gammaproteobacteria bacterium]|nr:hypothetical protein [Gammaproteobacteria bacterium]